MPPHQSSSSTLSYIKCHPTKVLHRLYPTLHATQPKFFIDSILHYMPPHQSSSLATFLHYMPPHPTKVLHWLPSYITCHPTKVLHWLLSYITCHPHQRSSSTLAYITCRPTKVLHRLYPTLHVIQPKFFIGYYPT